MADETLSEEWRVVEELPAYAVSNLGRVKRILPGPHTYPGRILKGRLTKGYFSVSLGRKNQRYIHTLVCTAFNGPRPSLEHEVAHWDGKRINNVPGNLRWATRKENVDDTIKHGRTNRGTRNPNAKLDERAVLIIRERLKNNENQRIIARDFSVAQGVISSIKNRAAWGWLP